MTHHRMYTIMVILGVVVLVGYYLRWNFRRAWYVLRTAGDENPLARTEVTDAPGHGATKTLLIRHAPACGVSSA